MPRRTEILELPRGYDKRNARDAGESERYPMKSSIGFLAAMRAEIDACLTDGEKVTELIKDCDDICSIELRQY